MSESVRIAHFPVSLLKAPLPHWTKMIWVSIKSFQGHNESAWPSLETIGEQIINDKGKPMDKGQVSRGVKLLVKHGFLKVKGRKNFVCLMPPEVDPSSTKVDHPSTKKLIPRQQKLIPDQQKASEKLIPDQRKVDHPSTEVDPSSTRTEKEQLKGSRKGSETRTHASYVSPTQEEVEQLFKDRQITSGITYDPSLEATAFFLNYEAKDWRVGDTPIARWQTKVDQWIFNLRMGKFEPQQAKQSAPSPNGTKVGAMQDRPPGYVDFSFLEGPITD